MPPIGVGEYQAVLMDNREGDRVVADLTPYLIRGQWNRYIDEISPAQVTLSATPECCDILCEIQPVRHDLGIVRSDRLVWQGPLVRIRSDRSTHTAELHARDVVWWLDRRVLQRDYSHTGPLARYIEEIITDGMTPDPRGLLRYLTIIDNGIPDGERRAGRASQTVYGELQELARTVVDFTTVGKRLIIAADLFDLGNINALNDEHFSDGVEVMIDGLDYRNVSYVRFNRSGISEAGSADPYFGLVEGIVREFSIKDEASAQVAADIDAAQGNYPPVLLFGEGGAKLSPEAPLDIDDLVPGVVSLISLTEVCPPVSQQARLLRVEVNFSNHSGESPEDLGTRWGPLGATVNRRQDV